MKLKFPGRNMARGENGQAFLLVLILLLLSSLMIIPFLNFTATGLKTGQMYENKTDQLYAADSGIEDAKWHIEYDQLGALFTNPPYSEYDYINSWTYDLPERVNGENVAVTFQNVWIPKDVPVPDPDIAESMVNGNLMVTSGNPSADTYEIMVTYYPVAGDDLEIQTLGVWLPAGFTYMTGSSNLESDPEFSPHAGGQALVWTFNNVPFKDFPGVNTNSFPLVSKITFEYSNNEGRNLEAVSWITTAGVTGVPYSWDADTRIHKVISVAGGTTVESYIPKSEVRQLGSAIGGNYYATGNSNLSASVHSKNRTIWHDPSSATVTASNIPENGNVAAAYLYWTGWKNDDSATAVHPLNPDYCNNFTNWTADSAWDYTSYSGRFTGYTYHRTGENLILKNNLDLSSYSTGLVTISWNQYKKGTITSDDGLDFAFSCDGGFTWSEKFIAFRGPGSPASPFSYVIPAQYLTGEFKIRFYVVGFNSFGKCLYLDNIKISAMMPDTGVFFKIDDGTGVKQVYLDGDGQPRQGSQELTASRSQVIQNFTGTDPHGFSYSSYRDITALVRKYSKAPTAPAVNRTGHATYWVGGIDADASPQDEWAYASWSVVIIYTSPETKGHQLYLYDRFTYSNHDTQDGVNVDFDGNGQPGGDISGFIVPEPIPGEINAGKITCFTGEGDEWYTGDYVALNGKKLWDGTSTDGNSKGNPNNVFNSTSMGLGTMNDGIDIDTLGIDPPHGKYITWASNLLKPGDTSAHIDMVTHTDVWNLVYIIISFRSTTTTGTSLNYLIR